MGWTVVEADNGTMATADRRLQYGHPAGQEVESTEARNLGENMLVQRHNF